MRRTVTLATIALVLALLFSGLVFLVIPSLRPPAMDGNGAPHVIPSLREWHGGRGVFTLAATSRIVVDPAAKEQLFDTARAFAGDLSLVTGQTLPIINLASPEPGDIFLTLTVPDQTIGDEGYLMAVGDTLTLRAHTSTGVFYGTRSVLQMLLDDPAKSHVPQGNARDWPMYRERGFMLDVARKFFPLSELKGYVRLMAWFKLNDFHLHLNDNELTVGTGPDWASKYSAFRLASPRFPTLAATDGAYTQQDMRELQDLARQYGMTITPELDAPAHALAITKFRPDLASATFDKSILDLSNPNTLPFLEALWNEFLPWFDSPQVHIGADEYVASDGESYRQFVNALDTYLKGKGREVRAWGSLSQVSGTTPMNKDVIMDLWDNDAANAPDMARAGYRIINANDNLLYIVPKAGYFPDFLDTKTLYQRWQPNIFDLHDSSKNLAPDDPHLLGGMFAVWNDKLGAVVSDADVYARVRSAMPTLGQKLWGSPTESVPYSQFAALAQTLGDAPGVQPPSP
ncbi:MAG TPA: family 20 glycosylhydrolase [Ktedonobacterales bacterium]